MFWIVRIFLSNVLNVLKQTSQMESFCMLQIVLFPYVTATLEIPDPIAIRIYDCLETPVIFFMF